MVDATKRAVSSADGDEAGGPHIEASGTVIAVEGDQAMVRIDASGCGRCTGPGGCGGGLGAGLACRPGPTYRVLNSAGSVAGARVHVILPGRTVRRSALAAYGYPLLALLGGSVVGSELGGEAGALAGALAGLCVGWLQLRRAEWRCRSDDSWRPTIRP